MHCPLVLALFVVAGSIAACGAAGPRLRQPVGRTTVTSQDVTAPGYTPPAVELYEAEQRPGPCGMERLPPIDFAFGSSDLEQSQELTLAQLARCLNVRPFDAGQLVLVGHADPIGSSTYNLDLAYDRAVRVKNRLIALGVRAERIVVTSAGESVLPPERWDEARRVDLVLTRAGAASPPEQ